MQELNIIKSDMLYIVKNAQIQLKAYFNMILNIVLVVLLALTVEY
jgi:hypothetical protein